LRIKTKSRLFNVYGVMLTAKEVAEILRCSDANVYDRIRNGKPLLKQVRTKRTT